MGTCTSDIKKGAGTFPGKRRAGFLLEKMAKQPRWTTEDEKYLEENWGKLSLDVLMKRLNRSKNAIVVKVNIMGLGAFLDNGDYVTFNQLMAALGYSSGGNSYKNISWIKNRGCPVKRKKVRQNSFKIIYINEFWDWAYKNRDVLDFSRFEENVLGAEPEWAKIKRRKDKQSVRQFKKTPWTDDEDNKLKRYVKQQKYKYSDLSGMLNRTEGAIQRRLYTLGITDKPIKANNHIQWTEQELHQVGELIKSGCRYEEISESVGKSVKAIRGRVYSIYLTESLDKVREIIGNGSWGDNKPEKCIKHWNVMTTGERAQVRDLLTRLASVFYTEFRTQIDNTEWGEFFQKEMCQNFSSECLKTEGCDYCVNFVRIPAQNCKMCGRTFFERKNNNFCQGCRDMRRKQYLKKRAI